MSFDVNAKEVQTEDLKKAMQAKVEHTLAGHGLPATIHVNVSGQTITTEVKPQTQQPFPLTVVINAFDNVYKDVQAFAKAFDISLGNIKGSCYTGIGNGTGDGTVPPVDMLKVNDYGVHYSYDIPGMAAGVVNIDDTQWDNIYRPYYMMK